MVSLQFFIYIILPAALCSSGVDSTSKRNEYQEYFLGEKPYHLHVPIVLKSGSLSLLEASGPVQACNGIALTFYIRVINKSKQNFVLSYKHLIILYFRSIYVYLKYCIERNVLDSCIHKSVQHIYIFSVYFLYIPSYWNITCEVISKGLRKYLHSNNYSWRPISMILSRSWKFK